MEITQENTLSGQRISRATHKNFDASNLSRRPPPPIAVKALGRSVQKSGFFLLLTPSRPAAARPPRRGLRSLPAAALRSPADPQPARGCPAWGCPPRRARGCPTRGCPTRGCPRRRAPVVALIPAGASPGANAVPAAAAVPVPEAFPGAAPSSSSSSSGAAPDPACRRSVVH